MPIPILMPALSPTMEEGTLAKWLVKEGDRVSAGDVIAEIETDKATMEVEAVDEGVIGKIIVAAGQEHVAVNAPIAVLLEEGEDASALEGFEIKAPPPKAAASSSEKGAGRGAGQGTPTTVSGAPVPHVNNAAVASAAISAAAMAPSQGGAGGRVAASPLARRMAAQNGIDIASLIGSGPGGRIIRRDVVRALDEGMPVSRSGPAAASPSPQGLSDEEILAMFEPGSFTAQAHSKMRQIVAERLTLAKSTIPHFYLSIDVALDALLAARQALNAAAPPADEEESYKVSVNDYVIKAMAYALQQVPAANATWTRDAMLMHEHADVAVAVAVEGGLFTPVIRQAERKSLIEISKEMKDLANRARNKKLAPHEYQGGTTSISNLGMFGIRRFDAVINPPHATILAVGMGEKRPIVKDDQLAIATMMSVTLSCDHRVVDGALGAQLLAAFKQAIENPALLAG